MKELILHIIGNSEAYINEYDKKDSLTDKEKGILLGLWMDLDSLNNHIRDNDIKVDINIEELMNKLTNLIDTK